MPCFLDARSMWVAAALGLAMPTAAFAGDPTVTGTGGGPTSTFYAPNTSPVGRVMPPGRGAGPESGAPNRDRPAAQQREADNIMRGICIGCGAK